MEAESYVYIIFYVYEYTVCSHMAWQPVHGICKCHVAVLECRRRVRHEWYNIYCRGVSVCMFVRVMVTVRAARAHVVPSVCLVPS